MVAATTTSRLTTQPGPDASLASDIAQPFVVFRPLGATQIARALPGVFISSTYTGITAVGGPYGRGPRAAGGTSDGIEHVLSQEMDRNRYAVAVMFRIESSGVTQTITTLHGGTTTGLQLRINTSNQLEALSEGAALLGTSTFAGFTAGTTHTIVALQQASGGPLVISRNGAPILTISAGHQLTATTVNVVFARRQQAGEKFAGTILEAAIWSEDVPSGQQALAISRDYFGAMFAPRCSVVPVAGGGGPDITLALSGVSATSALGTFGLTRVQALSGVSASSAVGQLIPGISLSVGGVQATGVVGSIIPSLAIGLIGLSASGAVGNLTASGGGSGGATLSGVSATVGLGTLGANITIQLSGVAATAALGTLSPSSGTALITLRAGSWIRFRKLS